MSSIQNQIADRANLAVVLLGGATAQSYSAVSLNVLPAFPDFQETGIGFPGAALGADEQAENLTTGAFTFSLLDFIEQAIPQADSSRQEFKQTFDGSRQVEFRELLSSSVDAVAQPIGSIALPQASLLLANSREELSVFSG